MASRLSSVVGGPLLGCVTVLLASVVTACGVPAPAGAPPEPPGGTCAVGPLPDPPGERPEIGEAQPLVVGLPGSIDPTHAPVPRSPGERLLFAQLYETLVVMGCEGRVQPALARSWKVEEGGRRWTFTLRPDIHDWEGQTVDASDVGSSWLSLQEEAGAPLPSSFRSGVFTRLTVLDPLNLVAELRDPVGEEFFARPELAVHTGTGQGGWVVGTGPFHPRSLDSIPPPGATVQLEGPIPLELRPVSGDLRDALDLGVELLPTSDPAVLQYAMAASQFQTAPLGWDRTYLLVSRATTAADGGGVPPDRSPHVLQGPRAALESLAADAVRIEARPAELPPESCVVPDDVRAGAEDRPLNRRIVYPAGDGVARALAERLVALALDPRGSDAGWLVQALPQLVEDGGQPRAEGLPPLAFDRVLREGGDAAYVFSVPRGTSSRPCALVEEAQARVPWLGRVRPLPSSPQPVPTMIPLIETRSTLVLRRGIVGVALDGDGILRLAGARHSGLGRDR